MPYPNEHACRLQDPKDMEPDSYTSGTRTSQGKLYRIIFARKKGASGKSEQAYRYNKKQWSVEEARSHCERHGGQFEAAKTADDINFRVVAKDAEKQVIYGIVFEPDYVDMDGDYVTKEDIENAAHEYLINSRKIKLSHQIDIDNVCDVVESYVAPVDLKYNEHIVKEGSWVIGIKIWDTDLWKETENAIVGLSAGGYAAIVEEE